MMALFDSHCHVDEPKFDDDREDVLTRMAEAGVTRYAVIGSDMATSRHSADFAAAHPGCYAAIGIHPHEAKGFVEDDLQRLADWSKEEKVVAIGEIGLDYYYDLSPRETQMTVCEAQMELAWELSLPVAYHIRDAHQDMLDIMKRHKKHLTGGIIHCFSGSYEMAKELVKRGWYIGFTGVVTFKNARKAVEVAEKIPLDRILIETDCPYMAPEPFRGRRNDPSLVPFVAKKIAELRGISAEAAAAATAENARRLFRI